MNTSYQTMLNSSRQKLIKALKHLECGQKHLILARMKELIGEQKIDLKIAEVDEIKTDPFLQIIFPKSISLKIWN